LDPAVHLGSVGDDPRLQVSPVLKISPVVQLSYGVFPEKQSPLGSGPPLALHSERSRAAGGVYLGRVVFCFMFFSRFNSNFLFYMFLNKYQGVCAFSKFHERFLMLCFENAKNRPDNIVWCVQHE
jgi:hypothetical protein